MIFAVAVFVLPTGRAVGGDAELKRFLSEYPAASRALEKEYSHIMGKAILRERIDENSTKTQVSEASFAADHGFQKVSIRHHPHSGKWSEAPETVYCLGPGSGFMLMRNGGSREYEVASAERTEKLELFYQNDFGQFLTAPHGGLWAPLRESMERSSFQALSAEQVDGPDALIRVRFRIGGKQADEYQVDFDPARRWVIRSLELRPGIGRGRNVIRYRNDYNSAIPEVPVPKRVEYLGATGLPVVCEFTEFQFGSTPESSFSMTSFGLPDLTKPDTPRRSRLPWIAAAAGACLALAIALRWIVGLSTTRRA